MSTEQQKAVSKYEEVIQQLSLSKEFCKQFQKIASDATKEAKREARKVPSVARTTIKFFIIEILFQTLFTRQHQEVAKVREVLIIQDILQRLKVESIRSDFLNQRNGACSINKAEMEFIDRFTQLVVPVRPNFSNEPSFASAAKASAEVFSFLVDERNREFQDTGFTFEKGKELFNRIQACGYWERDVKIVEAVEESRAAEGAMDTNNLGVKSEIIGVKKVAAPAPAQVPTPTFNGNVNSMMSVQQQHMQLQKSQSPQQAPLLPSNPQNMKTTVTAVENAYFNQIKYSQQGNGQLISSSMPIPAQNQNDFSTNFSFLQDSELDSPAGTHGSQQQHKMSVNVIQSNHQQPLPPQQFKNANFHPQSSISAVAGQIYPPPGLKVQQSQNSVSHIPVNYQASPQQLNQQNAVTSSQVPSHMIPKQQQPINGNQISGYATQTPPITQQSSRQRAGSAQYPALVPTTQYQQQNAKHVDQTVEKDFKTGERDAGREKEKPREEYQDQPQIDTWTNETAQTGANGNPKTSYGGRI